MRIVLTQKQKQALLHYQLEQDQDHGPFDFRERQILVEAWAQYLKEVQEGRGTVERLSDLEASLKSITDQNIWKSKKSDLVFWIEALDVLDEILLSFSRMSMESENEQSCLIQLLKFIKYLLGFSQNIQYFSSLEILIEMAEKNASNYEMQKELMDIFIVLSSYKNEKRSSQDLQYKVGNDSYAANIKKIMSEQVLGWLFHFFGLANNLQMISQASSSQRTGVQLNWDYQIESNTQDPAVKQNELAQWQKCKEIIIAKEVDKQAIEEALLLSLRAINLYLNTGDLQIAKDKFQQTARLQSLLPPKRIIDTLIQLLQNQAVGKKVQSMSINVIFMLVVLDLNSIFSFEEPTENPYYQAATHYQDFYIQIIQSLAYYHAFQKLLRLRNEIMNDSNQIEELINKMRPLVLEEEQQADSEEEQKQELHQNQRRESSASYVRDRRDSQAENMILSDTIKSQAFLNSFLTFALNFLNIKNRAVQSHLYPQFVKPLLALISVGAIDQDFYPINIKCQVRAIKLLKDAVKASTLEDLGAVEMIISRVNQEIGFLREKEEKIWRLADDDDTENRVFQPYRQDVIRNLLRFLCQSIIRNDPNAINFQQNFVSNSRKILDCGLIQDTFMNKIFNIDSLQDMKLVNESIDPVSLQCLQLVSFVFNDLPSKITLYEDMIKSILNYLYEHIPLQPDLFSIFLKFVQTLQLQESTQQTLLASRVFDRFTQLCLDKKAHKHIVSQVRASSFRDTLQQIAVNNKDLAKQILMSIIARFDDVVQQSWSTTLHYIDMEERFKRDLSLSEEEKQAHKTRYDLKQLSLEQNCEMVAHMLWYLAIDDQVYRDDNFISAAIIESKDAILQMFRKVITTPIFASGCPNMFQIFIEVMIHILQKFGEDQTCQFMESVIEDLNTQIENVYLVVGTNDLDKVEDLENLKSQKDIILDERLQLFEGPVDELGFDKEKKKEIVQSLTGDDQLAVVFAKIAVYSSILKVVFSNLKMKLFNTGNLPKVIVRLYKVQSLVNRYHASKYKRDLLQQKKFVEEKTSQYQHIIDTTDWESFSTISSPPDEETLFKNYYHVYIYKKITSICDPETKKSGKTVVELDLDENLSHTSNICQIQIRKLMWNILRLVNRKKIHFTEKVPIDILEFNREIGKQIADQFNKDFQKIMEVPVEDHFTIMKYCCQYSAILGEFSKYLFQSNSHGAMLLSFANHGGFDILKQLVLFLVDFQYHLQTEAKPFMLLTSRNLQLLWSHIIDFFLQLIDGKYIDMQFQQFLISFKTHPSQKIKQEDQKQEYELAVKKMQKYFISLFGETLHFIFVELNNNSHVSELLPGKRLTVFQYFENTSELFYFTMIEVYEFVTKGLSHIKIFNEQSLPQLKMQADPSITKVTQYDDNKARLVEMGFSEEISLRALRQTANDIEFAIELLSTNQILPLPDSSAEKKEESVLHVEEDPSKFDQFEEFNSCGSFQLSDLYDLISKSLPTFLRSDGSNKETQKMQNALENVFFLVGRKYEDAEVKEMLQRCVKSITELISEAKQLSKYRNSGILSYSLAVILTYKRGILISEKILFQCIFDLISLLSLCVDQLHLQLIQSKDFKKEEVALLIKQLEQGMSLFLFISEESKISSDLLKVQNLVTLDSSLINPALEIQQQLQQIQELNKDNIFYKNKEHTAEVFHKITLLTVDLYKSMQKMDIQAENIENFNIQLLVKKSIENLNFMLNIKGYGDFDCQSCFLKSEGLRALFSIKFVIQSYTATRYQLDYGRYNSIQIQSKILLQQLISNEGVQIKSYENLIKSVLFNHFQERFKKEEGQSIKQALFNFDDAKASHQKLLQQNLVSQSKKKKSSTPLKTNTQVGAQFSSKESQTNLHSLKNNNQADDDRGVQTGSKGQTVSTKSIKQQLFKKAEYCEIGLEDFITFFSNVMQVQDSKSFLIACQNVCVIKKKEVNENPTKKILNFDKTIQSDSVVGEKSKEQAKEEETKSIDESSLRRSKRQKKNREVEEKKKQEEELKAREPVYKHYIALSMNQLKDMTFQYGQYLQQNTGVNLNLFNIPSGGNAGSGFNMENEKQQQSKQLQNFQEQIVFTFLDLFIDQIREDKMVVQQFCKMPQQQESFEIKENEKSISIVDKHKRITCQRFFFDISSILSHLTYVMNHQPILVQSLLKHKEAKTYKFIIRNIFFLATVDIQHVKKIQGEESSKDQSYPEYQVTINENQTNQIKRYEQITEFFKKALLENPHLTNQSRRAKQEARQLFLKEVLRNLQETNYKSQYPQWPLLGLIHNLGSVWLISNILSEEEKSKDERHSDDKSYEVLSKSMRSYRNVLRVNMIKQMIAELQIASNAQQLANQGSSNTTNTQSKVAGSIRGSNSNQVQQQLMNMHIEANQQQLLQNMNGLQLIKQFERVQNEVIKFMNQMTNGKESIQLCMAAVSAIIKPFQDISTQDGKSNVLQEKDLGFVSAAAHSSLGGINSNRQDVQMQIEEEKDEEDDDDEEEDDDEEDDDDEDEENEDEDDDLLGSQRSERNFRLSQNDSFMDEYGDQDMDEEGEDSDDEDEDDDGDENQVSGDISASLRGGGTDFIDDMLYGDEEEEEGQEDEEAEVESDRPVSRRNRRRAGAAREQDVEMEFDEEPINPDLEAVDEDENEDSYHEPMRQPQSSQRARGAASAEGQQDNQNPNANRRQGNENEEEGEYDEEEDEEEEYDDDGPSDEYYNDEVDDYGEEDDDQIEIFIGGPGNRGDDRLSNAEYFIGGPNGQRIHPAMINRRNDDLNSVNNLSIDMFNMNGGGNRGMMGHINEESDSVAAFSEDDNQPNQPEIQQLERLRGGLNGVRSIPENLGGIISSILDNFMGGAGRRGRGRAAGQLQSYQQSIQQLLEEKLNNQSDVIYSPLDSLTTIFNLTREVQDSPQIYKQYIKEIELPSNQTGHQMQGVETNQINSKSNLKQSQKEEFDLIQQDNQLIQKNTSARQQGAREMEIAPQRQQNIGGLEMELDPLFLEGLDDVGLQNLVDTESVIHQLQSQSQQQAQEANNTIQNTVQLLDSIRDQSERNRLYQSMTDEAFNQLPARFFNEGLSQRPASQVRQHVLQQRNSAANQQVQQQQPLQQLARVLGQAGQANNQLQVQVQVQMQAASQNLLAINGQQVLIPLHNLMPADQRGRGGRRRDLDRPEGRGLNHAGRERLISLDSQLNDLVEFSRSGNDPFIKNTLTSNQLKSDQPIDANLIFNSFLNHLKDLIIEIPQLPLLDSKGNDVSSLSLDIIKTVFIPKPEQLEQGYSRLSSFIDMIMIWVQTLTNGYFFMAKDQNLMRQLFGVTIIRQGVLLKITQWIFDGVQSFSTYYKAKKGPELSSQQSFYNPDSEVAEDDQAALVAHQQGFKVERGYGLPGKLDIVDFILHCLRCFKSIIQQQPMMNNEDGLELLKPVSAEPSMKYLCQEFQKQRDGQSLGIDVKRPLLEQIMEQLLHFVKMADLRPDLINQSSYMVDGKEVWIEDVIGTLVNIFEQITPAAERFNKSSTKSILTNTPLISDQLINCIGELLLTKEFKSKDIQKYIKQIFGDICKINDSIHTVRAFFKQSLSNSLLRIIGIINSKNAHVKLDNESLKKEVIILTQILKIAKSNKKEEINICDQDLFFRIVKEISYFIEKKLEIKGGSNSIGASLSQSQISFVLKEEFRTLMIALFILFEYNLKFIFTEAPLNEKNLYNDAPKKKKSESNNNQRRNQAAANQEEEKKAPENENLPNQEQQNNGSSMQIDTKTKEESGNKFAIRMEEIEESQRLSTSAKDKADLMQQIDAHLNQKIKDEKARNDERLRVFIKFCLQHKKIINCFIRANQQVLNDSLRNVILKVPQLLDFDNKRLLFRAQIKKIQRKYRLRYIDLQVRRDKVFDDSYEQLRLLSNERWRGKLNVEFVDEQGIDEGGLSKEWFILLSKEIFNADLALFLQSNAGSSYYPNPKSNIQPDYEQMFKFIGKLVGKAIYEQQLLDCYFVKALYKLLLGMPLNYHDVEDFDDQIYQNLSWCLQNSVDGLGITFTETIEYFGKNEEIEIIPGGANIDVTDENKSEYVKTMAYHKLYASIKNQINSFLEGFFAVVPRQLIQIFDNRELELLISGLPTIDIADLRENTIYTNYSAESPVIKWLFEVLEEFDNSERAEFIQFVTGSSKVPVEGFKGLRGSRGFQKFQVIKFFTNDVNRLPQAHTCFKQLELPEYQSKEQLKDRLYTAIKEGKTFGFA